MSISTEPKQRTTGQASFPNRATTPDAVQFLDLLSPQQRKVFELLGEGLANKEIAYSLDTRESTIKAHVSAILAKLNCSNRTKAALLAFQYRLTGTFQPIVPSTADVDQKR